MASTPICPKCGSAAVESISVPPMRERLRRCERCGYQGRISHFTTREPSTVVVNDAELRKRGNYMPSRTIPLSDE
jgi:uncharacterized Zn finger protein